MNEAPVRVRHRVLNFYPCPHCQWPFSRRSNLIQHLKRMHGVHPLEAGAKAHAVQPVRGREESVIRYIDNEDRHFKGAKSS